MQIKVESITDTAITLNAFGLIAVSWPQRGAVVVFVDDGQYALYAKHLSPFFEVGFLRVQTQEAPSQPVPPPVVQLDEPPGDADAIVTDTDMAEFARPPVEKVEESPNKKSRKREG